jgi:hypothetical protein
MLSGSTPRLTVVILVNEELTKMGVRHLREAFNNAGQGQVVCRSLGAR